MKETRRLVRNFGAIAAAKATAQALTFVVSLAVARSLGVQDYGLFVFGFAFPSWLVLFVSLGLDSVLTIDVAADRSRVSQYLTSVTVIRIPLVILALFILYVSIFYLLDSPRARLITYILGAATVLGSFVGTYTSVFRAFERLEYGALITVMEKGMTTSAVLLLVYLGFDLVAISLAFLGGTFITLVTTLAVVRRSFAWFERRLDVKTARHVLRRSVPFALAAVVTTAVYSTAPVLLTLLRNTEATGYFNAAFVLVLALVTPLSICNIVFLPAMTRICRETPERLAPLLERSQRVFFTLGVPAALGGWFYAEEIVVLIYGEAFREAARSLEILVFHLALAAAVLGIGTALTASNHQTLNLGIRGGGAAVNVVLCFLLIPHLGHVGASIGFLLGELAIASLDIAASHLLLAPAALSQVVPRPLASGLTMLAALWFLPTLPLWLGIAVGSSTYFGMLLLLGGLSREDLDLISEAMRGALFR